MTDIVEMGVISRGTSRFGYKTDPVFTGEWRRLVAGDPSLEPVDGCLLGRNPVTGEPIRSGSKDTCARWVNDPSDAPMFLELKRGHVAPRSNDPDRGYVLNDASKAKLSEIATLLGAILFVWNVDLDEDG